MQTETHARWNEERATHGSSGGPAGAECGCRAGPSGAGAHAQRGRLGARSGILALLALVAACRGGGSDAADSAAAASSPVPAVRTPVVAKSDDARLLFRYWDSAVQTMKTARGVAAVPEAARQRVLVFDEERMLNEPPGAPVTVADLRTPGSDGRYPSELVDIAALEADLGKQWAARRAAEEASAAKAAPADGSAAVVLYSTQGCPHCRTARNWLKGHNVPFVEKDVERDATARPELLRLGKAQGVDPALLQAVPILLVKGRLVLGWNAAEVQRLLGG